MRWYGRRLEWAAAAAVLALVAGVWATVCYYDVRKSGSVRTLAEVPSVGPAFGELKVTGDVAYTYHRQWRGAGVLFSADATEDDVRAFCEAAGLTILAEILNKASITGMSGGDSDTAGGILTEFEASDMSARGRIPGVGAVMLYYSRSAGRVTVRVRHPWRTRNSDAATATGPAGPMYCSTDRPAARSPRTQRALPQHLGGT